LGNAIWYSWVTFATVGYGDFNPVSWLGKLIATLGISVGMLWFAMPITIVGSTFQVAACPSATGATPRRHRVRSR